MTLVIVGENIYNTESKVWSPLYKTKNMENEIKETEGQEEKSEVVEEPKTE